MEPPNNPEDLKGKQESTSGPVKRSTKEKWTPEEDGVLRKAVELYEGKNWKKIAECLKNRTEFGCRHRWQNILNQKTPWSKEEDNTLIALVHEHGQKWSTISQHLPGRIGKQCRERWQNHLDPETNKNAWAKDDHPFGATEIEQKTDTNEGFSETTGHLASHGNDDDDGITEQQELSYILKESVKQVLPNSLSSPSRANKISFPTEDKPAEKDKRALSCEPSSSPSAVDPSFDNKDDHVPANDDFYHILASWNDLNLLYYGETTSVGLDDSDFFPTMRTKNDQLQGVSHDAKQDLDLDLLTPTMDDDGTKNQALKSLVRLGDQPSSPNLDTDPETETVFTDEELRSFFANDDDDDDDITEQQELPKMNEENNQLRD